MKYNLGKLGEDIACKYLIKKGYKILERNFCNSKGTRLGEIDIITLKAGMIIFVEVKTRNFNSFELPESNISRDKLSKLNKAAQSYINLHKIKNDYSFDAISIFYDEVNKLAKIRHIESIFI